jgi:dihydrodipicolinate synthase/N-acetylneuraminate lyase
MSAVLLPFGPDGLPDWDGFDAHVARTAEAGLTPAVNMDTGYVHLLDEATWLHALDRTATITGDAFVSGALAVAQAVTVRERGGTPVVVPNDRLGGDVVASYREFAAAVDRFIGFELSPLFHPVGRIWDLDTYERVLAIEACVGAKHSSLERTLEWDRLRLRDAVRPDFQVLTGNDLAIDMVMYGSDYLLGLSTFAPELFAERDRLWAGADPRFYELNDSLQHLGNVAFRPPVPAYRHSAALFLRMRGWTDCDATPEGVHRRPAHEETLLRECGERLGLW